MTEFGHFKKIKSNKSVEYVPLKCFGNSGAPADALQIKLS